MAGKTKEQEAAERAAEDAAVQKAIKDAEAKAEKIKADDLAAQAAKAGVIGTPDGPKKDTGEVEVEKKPTEAEALADRSLAGIGPGAGHGDPTGTAAPVRAVQEVKYSAEDLALMAGSGNTPNIAAKKVEENDILVRVLVGTGEVSRMGDRTYVLNAKGPAIYMRKCHALELMQVNRVLPLSL